MAPKFICFTITSQILWNGLNKKRCDNSGFLTGGALPQFRNELGNLWLRQLAYLARLSVAWGSARGRYLSSSWPWPPDKGSLRWSTLSLLCSSDEVAGLVQSLVHIRGLMRASEVQFRSVVAKRCYDLIIQNMIMILRWMFRIMAFEYQQFREQIMSCPAWEIFHVAACNWIGLARQYAKQYC